MIEGAFKTFKHIHEFAERSGVTQMTDTLIWTSPFGLIGTIADKLLIERHMRDLVETRNARLKEIAEREIESWSIKL